MSAITSNDNSCAICYQDVLETHDTMRCTNKSVSHIFHTACVADWAKTRSLGEQVICILCREGSFLPIQGSSTENEPAEEFEELDAIETIEAMVLQSRQRYRQRRELLYRELQPLLDDRNRKNTIFTIGLIAGATLCLTRDIDLAIVVLTGSVLMAAVQTLSEISSKMDPEKRTGFTAIAVKDAAAGLRGITGGLLFTKIALMAISGANNIGRDIEL